jgi:hypothetical protein
MDAGDGSFQQEPYFYATINSAGYSDEFLYGKSPTHSHGGYHELLSGEWAAAVYYDGIGTQDQKAMWLTDEFIDPDWITDSDFVVPAVYTPYPLEGSTAIPTFTGQTSVVNDAIQIVIDYEIVDLAFGDSNNKDRSPMAYRGPNSPFTFSLNSERYVMLQTYTISNLSTTEDVNNLEFYQMLHSHPAEERAGVVSSVYGDELFNDPLAEYIPLNSIHCAAGSNTVGNFRYDITQWNKIESGSATHVDWVGFSSTVEPSMVDHDIFYTQGDAHIKPLEGTLINIENRALNGKTELYDGYAAGAMKWYLGSIDPNETVSLTVAFMFGHEEVNQNELLFDSSYEIGSGNSCADATDPNSKQITYTIAYDNPFTDPNDPNYIGPLYNVLVLDQLPAEVDFISALPDNYIYDPCDHTCKWRLDSIMPGDVNSFTIIANITQRAVPGSYIANRALLATAGKTISDIETTSVCGVPQLWNYWPLDEGSGDTCEDITANDNDLTFDDPGVTWLASWFDGCLEFNAVDVNVPNGSSEYLGGSFSVSAWIKPSSLGVVQRAVGKGSDTNGWAIGLTGSNIAEFCVTEDTGAVHSLVGTTTFDTSTWHHVVGVLDVENQQIRLYVDETVHDSNGITAMTGSMFNTSNLMMGRDEEGLYPFNGFVDDVRIYNYALGSSQIDYINRGGLAENPNPVDYEVCDNTANLSWVRSATATHHDVYLGTSYDAVLNATTGSPEYRGRQTETMHDPNPTLNPDTRYFWRIDEYDDGTISTGHVWAFRTSVLANGSFEDALLTVEDPIGVWDLADAANQLDNWTCTDPNLGTYLIDDTYPGGIFSGTYFPTRDTGYLVANTYGQTGNFILKQNFDVEDSQLYMVTFDAGKYLSHNTGEWLEVMAGDQSIYLSGDDLLGGNFPAIGTPYHFEFSFVASGTTAAIKIEVNGDYGFFIDNVKVMPPPDITPPTPDPAAFALAPSAISSTAIGMTAVTGSDETGPVRYYFTETSGNPGGSDSGWVTDPVYVDSGLLAGTKYSYTVQMRDGPRNTTDESNQADATTNLIIDVLQNGSFEDNTLPGSGTGRWDIYDPNVNIDHWACQTTAGRFLADNTNVFDRGINNTDGTYFLIASTYNSENTDLFNLTQDCNVVDGTTYTVSYDVGVCSGNLAGEYVEVSAGGQSIRLEDPDFPAYEVYYSRSFTFVASSSTATLQILADASEGFYIDNVKVQCEVPGFEGDLEPDGDVDLADLQYFALRWMDTGCVAPDWCEGADLDFDGTVSLADFTKIAENWLKGP